MVKPASQAPNLDDIASFTVSGSAGEFVYQEGDAGKEMFIIQEGRIELLRLQAGESRPLAVLEPGDFFGELSLLEDERRDASARAVSPFRLLRIDRTTLHQLVQENPEIAVRMLYRLASRLRAHEEATRRASEIAAGALNPMPAPREAKAPPPLAGAPAPEAAPPKPSAASAEAAPASPPASAPAPPAAGPRRARFVHASGREFTVEQTSTIGRFDRATGFTPEVDLTALDSERTLSRR